MAVVAAYAALVNHTKGNISYLGRNKSLLSSPGNKYLCFSNNDAVQVGCYLTWDNNDEVFIRSGSASGERGFKQRIPEHEKRAKDDRNNDDSLFYHLYPHSSSIRASNPAKKGVYDDLTHYIAASFTPDAATMDIISKDFNEGGIFFYTNEQKNYIGNTKFPGKKDFREKCGPMACYLFEAGYELMLNPKDNISESPGMERCGLKPVQKLLENLM